MCIQHPTRKSNTRTHTKSDGAYLVMTKSFALIEGAAEKTAGGTNAKKGSERRISTRPFDSAWMQGGAEDNTTNNGQNSDHLHKPIP